MSYVKNEWKRGDIVTAEKLNHMEDGIVGGSDPVLANAKSTGGIGWTESGGTETIVDNESVPTTKAEVVNYATGVFIETVVLEVGSNYSVIFNDSEYVVTGEDFGGGGGASVGAQVTSEGADFSVYPFAVIYVEGSPSILATQSGGTYTVTIKKSSDTIHKIDEKYLPASLMVVNFEYDDEFIADKTVEEVKTAMSSGIPVFAVYHNIIGDGNDLCGFMTTFKTSNAGTSNIDPYSPILMATLYGEDFSQTGYYEMPTVWVYNGEWMFED